MGYYIEINGSFQIDPPLDPTSPLASDFALTEWHVSPNGKLLFVPSGILIKVSTLEEVCKRLKDAGHSLNGRAEWRGEDDTTGGIKVKNNEVSLREDDCETLSQVEIRRFLGQLRSGDEAQKCEAVEILDYFGVGSAYTIGAITQLLSDASIKVRVAAATCLGERGEDAAPAVEALIVALSDEEAWMRAAAAEALGKIGQAAEGAIPHLEGLLSDPSYGPSGRAREALEKIGTARAAANKSMNRTRS